MSTLTNGQILANYLKRTWKGNFNKNAPYSSLIVDRAVCKEYHGYNDDDVMEAYNILSCGDAKSTIEMVDRDSRFGGKDSYAFMTVPSFS